MSIKLKGATSGSIELDVPDAIGSDLNVTLPATAGDVVVKGTDGSVDLGDVDIDSSGRLLVGTSSVIGTEANSIVQAAATTGGFLVLGRNDSSVASGDPIGGIRFYANDPSGYNQVAKIVCDADGTHDTDDYPTRLEFYTTADGASSETERMRLYNTGQTSHFSSGNVVISATSQNAGTTYYLFRGLRNRTSTTTGGATVFYVYSNGDVRNTNNSYGAISDVKLKENIVDATSQWDDLKAIRVRKYNLIEGETHTQLGVIAQEVETVSPGLVYETIDRDEEDNDLGTVTKNVNYSVLYMKAVKALQEAQTRIETLETQHADLLARVAALEASE